MNSIYWNPFIQVEGTVLSYIYHTWGILHDWLGWRQLNQQLVRKIRPSIQAEGEDPCKVGWIFRPKSTGALTPNCTRPPANGSQSHWVVRVCMIRNYNQREYAFWQFARGSSCVSGIYQQCYQWFGMLRASNGTQDCLWCKCQLRPPRVSRSMPHAVCKLRRVHRLDTKIICPSVHAKIKFRYRYHQLLTAFHPARLTAKWDDF